jgi:hypothetical protein
MAALDLQGSREPHRGPYPVFSVGDRVRCDRAAPAKGTWHRYAGKTGTIESLNTRDNEVGVRLNDGHRLVWFTPDELERV